MPGGDKNIKHEDGKAFSKENQPSTQAKVEGKRKAMLIRQIASKLVTGESKEALSDLAKYLGIDVDQIDIETAMHLKQIEKAIQKGDTSAYNAVMDRIKGKPIQAIDVTSYEPKPMRLVRPDENG